MRWIYGHQRIWRTALLLLLTGAMMGPWTYDLIVVPAEYTCSAPNIRLEGDYCGMPLSGMWILSGVVGGLIALSGRVIMEPLLVTDWVREVLFGLRLLLPVLPFFSTLLLFFGGDRRSWQFFQIVALCLAGGLSLLWATSGFARLDWALWGVWLYVALAASALILEMLALEAGRTARRPKASIRGA